MANIAVSHRSMRTALLRRAHAGVTGLLLVASLAAPTVSVELAGRSSAGHTQIESSSSLVTLLGHGVQALGSGGVALPLALVTLACGLLVTTAWLVLAAVVKGRGVLDGAGRELWTYASVGLAAGLVVLLGAALVSTTSCTVSLAPAAGLVVALTAWTGMRPVADALEQRRRA